MKRQKDELTYIGQNIRQLRHQRGWTIARLAAEIGMSEVPLGRIERGENMPSTAVVHRVARIMGVSLDTLFAEDPQTFLACQVNAADAPFVPTHGHGQFPPSVLNATREIIQAVSALETICGAQKQAKIPLNIPFETSARGLAELAERVRNYMSIGTSIVFDYFELFESMGFRVIIMPLPKETPSITFFDMENQNAFFFIRRLMTPERKLFHLAYGLGRILLMTGPAAAKNQFPENVDPDDDDITADRELTEASDAADNSDAKPLTRHRAARKFAAFFLMPESSVLTTIRQLGIQPDQWTYELLLRLKHRFGVSAEAFLFRLRELSLIDSHLHTRFHEQIQAYYRDNNFAEPDATRRLLTPNGRVWDLVLTARQQAGKQEQVKDIESTLKKWKVVKK
ncbi:MAG: XRE family transcriptional regulator [Thermodesulfobacteriota bacterium]|nr:XRE family transcriptional regulator [Thermodesulfobacteriota bacterium]